MSRFIIAFVIWAVLHSLTAAAGFKRAICQRMGEKAYHGLYRLAYNVFAGISFLPVIYYLAVDTPVMILWSWPSPWSVLARLVQLVGLVGLVTSVWQTDFWSFAGLRQAAHFLRGGPQSSVSGELLTSGLYGLVRHPIYTFSLLVLWFNPTVSLVTLIFNVLATLYFWLGSIHEERRLTAEFGAAYLEYRKRVPMLIPLLPGGRRR